MRQFLAILSRVSQRALWLRRISSMQVSASPGAEMPGKPRKPNANGNGVRQSFWRRSTHQPRVQRPLLFPKRPSTTTIKHLLCAAVKRQYSAWQRYRDDLELHRSEQNLLIARGHWRTTPWCLRGFPGTSAPGLVETGIELIRRSHSALWLTRLTMAITVSFRNEFSKKMH